MARQKKILVVEDEENIRNLLFDVLSIGGYKVTLAKDGQESLNRMKNRRFDLIITDINMPRLDGLGLLKKMKRAGRRERVIVMTASPVNKGVPRGGIPPVFTLLRKPFPIPELLDVVVSALAQPVRREKSRPHRVNHSDIGVSATL